jgi:zinc transport system substrate-binding protein
VHLIRSALTVLLLLAGVSCGGTSGAGDREGTQVVASFYPLAFVAEEVGGSLVEVVNLTPPGAEPHDLELTAGQVRDLAEADLIVYLGDGFQPSVEDAIGELDGDVVITDVLSTQEELLEAVPHEGEEEGAHAEDEHAEDEHAEEGQSDPHVWLDPQRTAAIARLLGERLGEVDPDNASTYQENAEALETRLSALDADYRDGLAQCERRSLVTSHEAFGYLAQAYSLEEIGVAGIDPEAEPSPGRLAEVADFVRAEGVTTIYFEVLVSPAVAETLAEETGVATARLDPLEGAPEQGDYFFAMRANLDALRQGLGCS